MIRVLCIIFLCMAVYGFYTDHNGAALISLFMIGFTIYGGRQLDKRDREFEASPEGAKPPSDTQTLLDLHSCEASQTNFWG